MTDNIIPVIGTYPAYDVNQVEWKTYNIQDYTYIIQLALKQISIPQLKRITLPVLKKVSK